MNFVFTSKTTIILSVFLFISTAQAAVPLPAIDISGGEEHTLVLGENTQAFSCGSNSYSQLGLGEDANNYKVSLYRVHGPNDDGFLDGINDVEAGYMHSLALDANGCVWAWGDGTYGELGNGLTYGDLDPEDPVYDGESTPVRVLSGEQDPNDPDSLLRYIIKISAGRSGNHSLAIDANNYCYAWGRGLEGQLGNGSTSNRNVPVEVNDTNNTGRLENIIEVSAGEENSMALDVNGFVWTFGDNAYGKLGVGKTENQFPLSETPVKVHKGEQDVDGDYLENIVGISAGWDHCMAREGFGVEDFNICGRVFCWGNNGDGYTACEGGRLGNGETSGYKSTPVIVLSGQQDPNAPYLKNIVEISAGESHSMALDATPATFIPGAITSMASLGPVIITTITHR